MLGKATTILTIFDLFEQEKNLNKHHRHMEHADKLQKAKDIVRNHLGYAMGAALIPVPGADLLAVSAVQLNMLRQIAKLYNVGFMDVLGRNIISAIVGSSLARIGASLVKAIPGVGTVIGELSQPILAGASTYALGHVVAHHFHNGGTLEDLDLQKARKRYQAEMEEGKRMVQEIKIQDPVAPASDNPLDKITKLAEMRDAGILTEEEFATMKEKLLAQV